MHRERDAEIDERTKREMISIPQMDCPDTLLPSVKDLQQTLGSLAALPAELERIATLTLDDKLLTKVSAVQAVVDGIEDALGNFPLSYIPDGSVKCPEWEKQDLAQCIHNEFKFICQVKIVEIVTKVIPIDINVPTPLGFTIDIVALFKDPEYKAQLIQKIKDNFEEYRKMLPSSMGDMWKEMGIVHDEMGIRKMMEYIIQQLSLGIYGLLMKAFAKAIELVEKLSLGILPLPALLSFDPESFFKAMIEDAKKQGGDWLAEVEKQLEAFSVFGFSIMDIMGGSIEEKVQSTARRVSRMMENFRKFAIDWPILQLELWIEKVMSLLEKIGIKIPFIPFTFCDLFGIIGLPKSIALPEGLEAVAELTSTTSPALEYNSNPNSNVNPDGSTPYNPNWTPPE